MLMRFLKDERGATAIEYGLIAAFVFLACMTAIFSYGDQMMALYVKIGGAVTGATAG